jgi:hypothetical protein
MAATGNQVVSAGGVIVEILGANAGGAASKADLDAWVNTYSLPVTSVRDPDSMPMQSMNALIRREYCYIIDLSTMKIVNVDIGSIFGIGASSASTSMTKMMQLLGSKGG